MERQIGDLGQQIRQPSNPFSNLCQVALRRSQINALKSMCPELDNTSNIPLPAYSHDNGDGYIFLVPRQKKPMKLQGAERQIVEAEFQRSVISKWGRLRLQNGQVARSVFSEGRWMSPNTRVARNLKVNTNISFICLVKINKICSFSSTETLNLGKLNFISSLLTQQ